MNEKTRLEFSSETTSVYFPLASVTVPLAVPRSTTFTPGMASPFSLVILPETVNAKSSASVLPHRSMDDADAAMEVTAMLPSSRTVCKKIADCSKAQNGDKLFFINSLCCDLFWKWLFIRSGRYPDLGQNRGRLAAPTF